MAVSELTHASSSLFQLGVILRAYAESGEGGIVLHSYSLRKWAEDKRMVDANATFWVFRDPNSAIEYDWIIAPPDHPAVRAYAPRSFGSHNTQQPVYRMFLNTKFKVEVVDEAQFFQMLIPYK